MTSSVRRPRVGSRSIGAPLRRSQTNLEALGSWQWPMLLGGLALIAVYLPARVPGFPAVPLPWIAAVSGLIILDFFAGRIGAARWASHWAAGVGVVFSGVLVLLVPLVAHPHGAASLLSYVGFALATVAGAIVGRRWRVAENECSWVDVGLLVFAIISTLSLVLKGLSAGSMAGFHRAAVLSWGASNYVAGVLVVVALLLWSRRRVMAPAGLVALATAGVAVLTLSRGAFVALGAGLMVLLWNSGRSTLTRLALRIASAGTTALGLFGMERITAARSEGGYDPSINIDARFALYQQAWAAALENPLVGSGWLGLRVPSEMASGTRISFAHNLVLSFMQIGGALGVAFLLILAVCVVRAWNNAPELRPAIAAGLAISMSDPFFEGPVAAFIMWMALGRGLSPDKSQAGSYEARTESSRSRRVAQRRRSIAPDPPRRPVAAPAPERPRRRAKLDQRARVRRRDAHHNRS